MQTEYILKGFDTMKKAEKIAAEIKEKQALSAGKMTSNEYMANLMLFEKTVSDIIYRETGIEDEKLAVAAERLEKYAEERCIESDEKITAGIAALRKIDEQIAQALSGRKGEDEVAQIIKKIHRNCKVTFRNIYITDEEKSSELDAVLITDAGIIIIETKSSVKNIEITRSGHLKYGDTVCHGQNLSRQMTTQRYLLWKLLTAEMESRGINIPLAIDSFTVFRAPEGKIIKVRDKSRLEKWCFKSELKDVIERYSGQVQYTREQVSQLQGLMSRISRNAKNFCYNFDTEAVISSISEMIAALSSKEDIPEEVLETPVETTAKSVTITACVWGAIRKIQSIISRK